jgi:hypothetical protein
MEMPGYQSNLSVKQRAQARRRERKRLVLAPPLGPHVRLALQWGLSRKREAHGRKEIAEVAAQAQVLVAVARLLDEGIADPSVDRICIQLGLPWSKRLREHNVIPCLMELERDGVLAFPHPRHQGQGDQRLLDAAAPGGAADQELEGLLQVWKGAGKVSFKAAA